MAVKQFVLTLDATVQNLGVAFPTEADTPFVYLRFTQQGAADAFIGEAGKVVSSTNYGCVAKASAPAGGAAELFAQGGSPLKLSQLEVVGTNTQKLSIIGVVR